MRVAFLIVFCVVAVITLPGCSKNDEYVRGSKTIDSLSGSVIALERDLKITDTSLLSRSINRYLYYRQFIHRNVNDTLSKSEAEDLRRFLEAGENLEAFQANRKLILSRAVLVNQQLAKLSEDVKNKSMETAALAKFCQNEGNEVKVLSDLAQVQARLFYTAIEAYKNSLKGVEYIIRSRNNGELPVIIKDTIAL